MAALTGRDLLSVADLCVEELHQLLDLATQMKAGTLTPRCEKVLGLLFSKASTRTRVSFTVAMYQLGGQVIDLNPNVTQVSRGEPLPDTARVLDRYLDVVAIRTFDQADLETFANYAKMPVINALSDREHPCQALADIMTVRECFGQLEDVTLTYLGDGNNVAHSLLLAGAMVGMNIRVATPEQFEPDPSIVEQAKKIAQGKSEILITHDPIQAVKGVQVLYTDVWASMGQEEEARTRIPLFQPYQVNEDLFNHADGSAIILHCLPAHRGEEITDGAIEGTASRVWDQAENRMHAQKALLASVLGAI